MLRPFCMLVHTRTGIVAGPKKPTLTVGLVPKADVAGYLVKAQFLALF